MTTSNVDFVIEEVERLVGASFTDGDREALAEDLSRSQEVAVRVEGDYFMVHGNEIEFDPLGFLIEYIRWRVDDYDDHIVPLTWEALAKQVPDQALRYRLTPRSWLSHFYLSLLTEYAEFFNSFVDQGVFARDDVAAMERYRHHLVDWQRVKHELGYFQVDREGYLALFEAAERLFHSSEGRYVDLRPRLLENLGAQWYVSAVEALLGNPRQPRDQLVETVIRAVEEAVAAAEETKFGRGAPDTRAAADDFDRKSGVLKPNCDFWTYPELEFWSRMAVRAASAEAICSWLRTRGEVEMEGDCATLAHSDMVAFVDQAVAVVPKSGLCSLLNTAGARPPAAAKWTDVTHDNLKVVEYITDPAVRTALSVEIPKGETFVFQRDPGQISTTRWVGGPSTSSIPIQASFDEAGVRSLVARDLYLQLYTSEERIAVSVKIVSLTAGADPLPLLPPGVYALVVLQGVVAASPVVSNPTRLATPELIALDEGQLLTRSSGGPYDMVALRAGSPTATAILYRFA